MTEPQSIAPVAPAAPILTPEQQMNIEYNRLCNVGGDIEAKLIRCEDSDEALKAEVSRLNQQKDSNTKNLRALMKKAASMTPAKPVDAPSEAIPQAPVVS